MIARLSWRGPAADHNVKAMNNLEFQPQRRTLPHITTVEALGNNSFQMALPGYFIKLDPILYHLVRIANCFRGSQQFAQQIFSSFERNVAQIVTVAIEQVIYVKSHRVFLLQRLRRIRDTEARLNSPEVRPALLIEHHDFAVYDGLTRIQLLHNVFQFRIFRSDVSVGAGTKLHVSIAQVRQGSFSIPLDFKKPIRV